MGGRGCGSTTLPHEADWADNAGINSPDSVLFALLEWDTGRFTETKPENSPPGSIFYQGHSAEDWNRAITV